MKQLYANNAKTTLAAPVNVGDTSLVVTDGSLFPSPGSYEYFLVTLELGGSIEIVMVTGRTGNTFTIGGFLEAGETVPGRGQELTGAKAFAAGTRVECRVTQKTLSRMSRNLTAMTAVTNLVAPKDSFEDGYIIGNYDPFGNPIVAVAKDSNTWRFLNFTTQQTDTAVSGTTTSVTGSTVAAGDVATGKYIIQFTSGAQAGKIRQVNTIAAHAVTWTGALTGAPVAGDTFEILKANASIVADALANLTFPISDNTGTADAIAGTYPGVSVLVDNLTLMVVLTSANTVANPTFSPSGLTPKTITNNDGTALQVGQIFGTIMLRYESSTDNWRLVDLQQANGVQPINYFLGNF